jgi:hypothetical protein
MSGKQTHGSEIRKEIIESVRESANGPRSAHATSDDGGDGNRLRKQRVIGKLEWWARQDSNLWPPACEAHPLCADNNLAVGNPAILGDEVAKPVIRREVSFDDLNEQVATA